MRVGSWGKGNIEGKIYLINKKGNEKCGMEQEKGSV